MPSLDLQLCQHKLPRVESALRHMARIWKASGAYCREETKTRGSLGASERPRLPHNASHNASRRKTHSMNDTPRAALLLRTDSALQGRSGICEGATHSRNIDLKMSSDAQQANRNLHV